MNELDKIYELYKLKKVNRKTEIENRFESTAEHIYSSLILAQILLKKINEQLDENKIMKMILYHDLCEIYCGDTHTLKRTKKTNLDEKNATVKIVQISPIEISKDIKKYNQEFVKGKSREAKFVKAVDALDPIINELKNPPLWKKHGYDERTIRKTKEPHINEFFELKEFFEYIILELKNKKII